MENTENMELGVPLESSSLSTSSLSPNSSSNMKDDEGSLTLTPHMQTTHRRGRSSPPTSPASAHSSTSRSPTLQHASPENNNKSDSSSATSASALQTLAAHNKSSGFMITDILSRSNAANLSVAAAASNAAALQAAAASFPQSSAFQAAAAAAALSMQHAMQSGRLNAAGLRATDLSQISAGDLSHQHQSSSMPNFHGLPVPPNHMFSTSPHQHPQHPLFNQQNSAALSHHDVSSDDNLSDDENNSPKDNYEIGKKIPARM